MNRREKAPILPLFYQIDERGLQLKERELRKTLAALEEVSSEKARILLKGFMTAEGFRHRVETVETLLKETRATYI